MKRSGIVVALLLFVCAAMGLAALSPPVDASTAVTCEGTYSPSSFNPTNLQFALPLKHGYTRIGDTVTVFGNAVVLPLGADQRCGFELSLPFASNLSQATGPFGSGGLESLGQGKISPLQVTNYTPTNRASIDFNSGELATFSWVYYHFTYTIA